jgi:hypothetical protein
MQQVLFVDRMDPRDADQVARIWAEHDRGGLPAEIGVTGRTVFHFRGLYVHLVEAANPLDGDLADRIFAVRTDPGYVRVREDLAEFLNPYSSDCKGLLDTRAAEFYRWRA